MGFDKDDTRRVVNVSKRTTKVNLGMVLAVLLFFAAAGVVVWAFWEEPARAVETGPGAE
ncbi:hypothetical protein [Opitutus terrae]|uniref:Uncharacterized protein n=1 Tax=Opitutus terrae (strain DSM 11246 / JCM 15787 / PB90-1) TaxID=452637 RepID=B1ZWK2_OPITP|nr:hypothetical protein [Opitutus terrae]ACB73326.1 hypothetical protein Oter_0035 [Opitutus terrae PB90-1]